MKEKILKNFSLFGLVFVLVLFEILTQGRLLGQRNIKTLFNNFFSIGMCTVCYTFVMALGELDLSVGATVGFSCAMAAISSGLGVYMILPVALLSGLAVGMLNGVATAYFRVQSFIGTLATSFIFRGLTTYYLNGSVGIPIGMRVWDETWVKVTALVIVVIAAYLLYSWLPFGRHCRAVGASHEAARESGINVRRTRMLTFAMVGLVCGLIGFFTLCKACTASSKTGNAFEFDVLIAVLFGGMPLAGGWIVKFSSALIGAASIALLKSGMSLVGIDGLVQQVVEGIILIAAVVISFDRKNAAVIK